MRARNFPGRLSAARLAFAAAAFSLAWLWLGAAAWAHASLVSSQPADGELIAAAPGALALTFNEAVSPLSLKLVGPDGAPLPLGQPRLQDTTLIVGPPSAMQRGTYVLSWRVISEDGHPVGGSVVFSVGEVSSTAPAPAEAVDWTVRVGLWAARIALYVGLFIGVGGAFALAWLLPGAEAGRWSVLAASIAGVLGAVASTGFQGLDALGVPASWFFERAVWTAALATSFGRTAPVAMIAIAAAAAAVALRGTPARILAALALGGVGLALSLSGHASAAAPQWVMRPAVFLHAAAVAYWVGALLPLGLALQRLEPVAVAGLTRFSKSIPAVLFVLVLAGLKLAVVQVQRPAALLDTAYGRVLLVKLALVAALLVVAAANRWVLTARVRDGGLDARRRMVRTIMAETLLVVLVLGMVAMWRFTPPPRALAIAAAQPAIVHVHSARAAAFIFVTPGRAGKVAIDIDTLDGEMQTLDPKEVTLELSMPTAGIEPFSRKAVRADAGVWRIEGMTIPLPGTWTVGLDVLVSDFELAHVDGEIEIRP